MSVSSDTQKGSEVHSTDLRDRGKMLEFWSKEYKIDLNKKCMYETLLMMCLWTQQSDSCIMHLIEIECDLSTTDNYDGYSPLHLAIKRPTLMVAIELIKRGANINAQDKRKYTPLHCVVGIQETMCMLLYYGADVHLRCEGSMSPLGKAIYYGMFDSIQTLMDYHDDEDLYEEINVLQSRNNCDNLNLIVKSKNSRLFKLAWTYINHDSLLGFGDTFLYIYLIRCKLPTNEWFECLQLILQSNSIVDLIEHCNSRFVPMRTFISFLVCRLYEEQIELNKRISAIFTVLSLGAKISLNDFHHVFEFFGFDAELEAFIYAGDYDAVYDSEWFSFEFALLHFILALNNDFSTNTIISLLRKQMRYHHPYSDTKQNRMTNALKFFSINFNAKAELLCDHYCDDQIKMYIEEAPEVPSLLELSRNRIYLSIRNGHKIKKPYHFHDAVKNLLLPQKLKDVIIFKTPIY